MNLKLINSIFSFFNENPKFHSTRELFFQNIFIFFYQIQSSILEVMKEYLKLKNMNFLEKSTHHKSINQMNEIDISKKLINSDTNKSFKKIFQGNSKVMNRF